MEKAKLYDQVVDISKVNFSVIRNWIETTINQIISDDDIIIDYICELLTGGETNPDIRSIQLQLVSFIGDDEAKKFCKSLWKLLLSGQNDKEGIPKELIEQERKRRQKEAEQKAASKEQSSSALPTQGQKRYRQDKVLDGDRRTGRDKYHQHERHERQNQPHQDGKRSRHDRPTDGSSREEGHAQDRKERPNSKQESIERSTYERPDNRKRYRSARDAHDRAYDRDTYHRDEHRQSYSRRSHNKTDETARNDTFRPENSGRGKYNADRRHYNPESLASATPAGSVSSSATPDLQRTRSRSPPKRAY